MTFIGDWSNPGDQSFAPASLPGEGTVPGALSQSLDERAVCVVRPPHDRGKGGDSCMSGPPRQNLLPWVPNRPDEARCREHKGRWLEKKADSGTTYWRKSIGVPAGGQSA